MAENILARNNVRVFGRGAQPILFATRIYGGLSRWLLRQITKSLIIFGLDGKPFHSLFE